MELDLDLELDGSLASGAQGDDMAYKTTGVITLAQINALATDATLLAALQFDVTDVVDVGGKAVLRTDIDAASDTIAQNTFRQMMGQPITNFAGHEFTVAGTTGYNGTREISNVIANSGKLALTTTTNIGSEENGITATANAAKLANAGVALPALPATSVIFGSSIHIVSEKASTEQARANLNYLRADGSAGSAASTIRLDVSDASLNEAGSTSRVNGTVSDQGGLIDRTQWFLLFDMNNVAAKQLDDITGLDSGIVGTVIYVDIPETAQSAP